MKSYLLSFTLFLSLIILVGCNSGNKEKDLLGNWNCNLNDKDFSGTETLSISEVDDLSIIDKIRYSYIEEDINIGIDCKIINKGKWKVDNNELIVRLGENEISLDTLSLHIVSSNPKIKIDTLAQDYGNLRVALCEKLDSLIEERFSTRANKTMSLGTIHLVDSNTLLLEKNNINLMFHKISINQ